MIKDEWYCILGVCVLIEIKIQYGYISSIKNWEIIKTKSYGIAKRNISQYFSVLKEKVIYYLLIYILTITIL